MLKLYHDFKNIIINYFFNINASNTNIPLAICDIGWGIKFKSILNPIREAIWGMKTPNKPIVTKIHANMFLTLFFLAIFIIVSMIR